MKSTAIMLGICRPERAYVQRKQKTKTACDDFDGMISPELITEVSKPGFDESDELLEALAEQEPVLVDWIYEQADRLSRCYERQDASQKFIEVMGGETGGCCVRPSR